MQEALNVMSLKRAKSSKLDSAVEELRTKYGSLNAVARKLGLTWGQFQKFYLTRKKQRNLTRKIDDKMNAKALAFYREGPVGISLPEARYSKQRFLRMTLRKAWETYMETREPGERKMAYSTFAKRKPRDVKIQRMTPRNTTLCEPCCSFKLKSKALICAGMRGIHESTSLAINEIVCEYTSLLHNDNRQKALIGKYGRRDCIIRKCSACGLAKYQAQLAEENEDLITQNPDITWHEYDGVHKTMNDKEVRKTRKVRKSGKLSVLMTRYFEDLEDIALHKFLSRWQYDQMEECLPDLQPGEMLCSHDFSQNMPCYSQREIQPQYYDHAQVTLHPSVAFYTCPGEGCNTIVRHEVIHLSDNTKCHNCSGFIKCHQDTVKIVEQATGVCFTTIVNCTDQAPAQYKNKNVFRFISESEKNIIHHFLGSRHGKCYSDQAGGRFVQFIRQAIANEEVEICNAEDIAKFADEHYATAGGADCSHFRITINLIKNFPVRANKDSLTLPETRSLHTVKTAGVPGVVLVRKISCLCRCCRGGSGICSNSAFATAWVEERTTKYCKSVGSVPLAGKDDGEPDGTKEKRDKDSGDPDGSEDCKEKQDFEDDCLHKLEEHKLEEHKPEDKQDFRVVSGVKDIGKQEKRHSKDWSKILDEMRPIQSFDALERYCSRVAVPDFSENFHFTFDHRKHTIDTRAMALAHKSNIPTGLVPIIAYGDGNCFARSLSLLAFGVENRHEEIRVRLVLDGVKNKEKYLHIENLLPGCRGDCRNVDFVQNNIQYSQVYDGTPLNSSSVVKFYEADWLGFRKRGHYAGIFQIHSAASVLNAEMVSYYSNKVILSVCRDMNRSMFPLGYIGNEVIPVCHIMWSKCNWSSSRLDHFVPLVWRNE